MPVSARENGALVRRSLSGVLAGGDLAEVGRFLIGDVDDCHPVVEAVRGPDPVTRLGWRALAGADIDVNFEQVVATAARVAVRGRVSSSNRETFLDLAPTGWSLGIANAWFPRIEHPQIGAIGSLSRDASQPHRVGGGPRRVPLTNGGRAEPSSDKFWIARAPFTSLGEEGE